MTNRAATATVLICAYTMERLDQVHAAVASVRAQSHPVAQLLVVVDHNDELAARLSCDLIDSGSDPVVEVLTNTEQRGLSGARNTGVAAATSTIVAFLDDDAVASPTWLAELMAVYAADPMVAGVGGAAYPEWVSPRPRWFPAEFDWVVGCSYAGLPLHQAPVRNFIGANMSYRASAMRLAGPFTHGLGRIGTVPLGCEETEFGIRLRRADPRAVSIYAPAASVLHRVGPERTTMRYFRRRCYAEGLSKAVVARLAGSQAALASERTYVRVALLAGVVANLAGRRGPGGGARALIILTGLGVTTAGYLRGRLAVRHGVSAVVGEDIASPERVAAVDAA